MTDEIVKVQVRLIGDSIGIVTNRTGTRLKSQPIPPYAVKALGNDRKGYFKANWSSVVGWAIGDRVEDQTW